MVRLLSTIDNETIVRLSRLQNNNDVIAFIDLIRESKVKLDNTWHQLPKDDFEKYQGAGQALKEIIDIFDQAEELARSIK